MSLDPLEFGRLQAQVEHLTDTVSELRQDVKQLLAVVENARGGWKALMVVGSIAGAVGAVLAKLAMFLQVAPLPR